jgi:hypothetical protein
MRHEAHIRLVDAHAEGHGRDHHDPVLLQEDILVAGARLRIHARVVGERVVARILQRGGEALRGVAGRAIDDAALVAVLVEEAEELAPGILLGLHGEAQVRPVEALDEGAGLALEELVEDVVSGRHIGCRRERDRLHAAEPPSHVAQKRVFGPKIVPPLRDAMGLVDGEQIDAGAREPFRGRCVGEPFGRGVEKAHATFPNGIDDAPVLLAVIGRVEAPGLDAEMAHGRYLIAHERDQRRDHDREAAAHECRQLVAERLAGARRHHGEHVLAGQHRPHDLFLPLAEGGEAEHVVENLSRVLGQGRHEGPDVAQGA